MTLHRWLRPSAWISFALVAAAAVGGWNAATRDARADQSAAFFFSNESIGTLPGYWVDDAPWWTTLYFTGSGGIVETQAPMTCFVPEQQMHSLVKYAAGKGLVLLNHTGKGDEVRMRFFGDIVVILDSGLLASGVAYVGSTIGATFSGGEAVLEVGGRGSDSFSLPSTGCCLMIPVGKSGQGGHYALKLFASNGTAAAILWAEGPSTVRIIQDMP